MRTFLALELAEPARRELARRVRQVEPELPPARWVRPASFHLTLRFLGEVEPAAVERLHQPLAAAFAPSPVLTLRLGCGGCFPPARPARVAWVGVTAAAARGGRGASGRSPGEPNGGSLLRELHARVSGVVEGELGLAPEGRPFSPHVTVARCRRPWPRAAAERFERAFAGAVGEPFEVAAGSLMESRLGAGGARYRRLAAYPLQGGADPPRVDAAIEPARDGEEEPAMRDGRR